MYEVLSQNESSVDVLGDGKFADTARDLVSVMRRDIRTDWTVREDVRAKLRTTIRRLLMTHGYPPDKQAGAVRVVMDQMESMAPRIAAENEPLEDISEWLSIDGRVLFKATVAASETYNTAIEKHLRPLGIVFGEQTASGLGRGERKRPVREIVRVHPALNEFSSSRRASIETRRGELAQQFQTEHARPPTAIESIHLALQATLETRDATHEPRFIVQQRTTWHAEVAQFRGGPEAVRAMVNGALSWEPVTDTWVKETARQMVGTVESSRSTWQVWHVRAEAQRRVRRMDRTGEERWQPVSWSQQDSGC